MSSKPDHHPASFRDPDGFLFEAGGQLYRQVNRTCQANYDRFVQSGLMDALVKAGKLVASPEVAIQPADPQLAYRVLQPQRIPFISYPYEWSFSQLKDAALLTLDLQKQALERGMLLKDASAYNIQFIGVCPLLIDTLSFEIYQPGKPWTAYRQFCQHFLAPLALMSQVDIRLGQLLRIHIDGVPLDLAAHLLPFSTRLNPGLLSHIHLHAAAQKQAANQSQPKPAPPSASFSKTSMLGLVDNLESTIRGLQWRPTGTAWGDYYDSTNYTPAAFDAKKQGLAALLAEIKPATVWDLGANTGIFSRVASQGGSFTVSFDLDPAAVEQNYLQAKQEKSTNLLSLLEDLTNPSPSQGWNGQERSSLIARGPADAVLALALLHHLAISNNVPLPLLADFFAGLSRWLIIEFVPKEDSQVQRLLASRKDIFTEYTQAGFEAAFARRFTCQKAQPIAGSLRTLYLFENRDHVPEN